MRICILDCDLLAPELASGFHSYGRMFCELFARTAPSARCDVFVVRRGEYPQKCIPRKHYDAYLLTGSQSDAFSDEQWVVQLRGYVKQLFDSGQRLIGVCFGHQLIAQVLGARVGRAEQGWGVGAMHYRVEAWPEWVDNGVEHVCLLASHQDQVKTLPHGAIRFLSNDFCANAGFYIAQQVLCIQPHPEFTKDYSNALLQFRRDRLGEAVFNSGKSSLSAELSSETVGHWIKSFIALSDLPL